MYILIADSHCCTTETVQCCKAIILQLNKYSMINIMEKNILKNVYIYIYMYD